MRIDAVCQAKSRILRRLWQETTTGGVYDGPFPILLMLAGSASSTYKATYDDFVSFSYDGNASVTYEYNYTPVPEPSVPTMVLLGLAGIVVYARRRR